MRRAGEGRTVCPSCLIVRCPDRVRNTDIPAIFLRKLPNCNFAVQLFRRGLGHGYVCPCSAFCAGNSAPAELPSRCDARGWSMQAPKSMQNPTRFSSSASSSTLPKPTKQRIAQQSDMEWKTALRQQVDALGSPSTLSAHKRREEKGGVDPRHSSESALMQKKLDASYAHNTHLTSN